ncbi:hypothetical protein ACGFX4_02430 [Kitasatospora sp. NPDC048365]|uniref:hypothetical protein n=1 Tax=Kitasatospora sp. NPDC048365 TaxID=3364050 RepID=UPI00371197FB
MRMMIHGEMDTATSNQLLATGKVPEIMGKVMDALKPEAAYFYPFGGRRAFTLVCDLGQESDLVALVEPFWAELGADVTVTPCMTADELRAGLAALS